MQLGVIKLRMTVLKNMHVTCKQKIVTEMLQIVVCGMQIVLFPN